jgi:FkbM family methyltransferase
MVANRQSRQRVRSLIKRGIKIGLRRVGFEIRRWTVENSPDAQVARIVAHLGIDLVLDVGANEGQYAEMLRANGYQGRIVSFEPLSMPHAKLLERTRHDAGWVVAPCAALGDTAGEVVIHVAGNSLSSSLLEMLPTHEQAAPGSAFVANETVPLVRLDGVAAAYLDGARSVLLKMDTQGYEDRVLAGASEILAGIRAIQVELSMVPLYAGQLLFDDMRARLGVLGYELFAIFPIFVHEVTGQTLQVDGIFVRRNPSAQSEQ